MLNRPVNLLIIVLVVMTFVLSRIAHAAAGNTISNTATVNYIIGGLPEVQESSPFGNTPSGTGNGIATSFTEDRLINFTVVTNDAAAVSANSGQTSAVLTFSVTNTGNDSQDFLLSAVNTSPNPFAPPADNIDPVSLSVFVEVGPTPGYQVAEDTATFIDELPIGVNAIVYVVADIPVSATNDVAAVSLIVQVAQGGAVGEGTVINNDDNGNISPAGTYSNGGTAVVAGTSVTNSNTTGLEIIFNDPAGLNAEDVDSSGLAVQDSAKNGQHSDSGAFIVIVPANVVINKTLTVIDTLGGTDPHQGATLRYQLDVIISGVGTVDDLIITDVIPANTTYTSTSIILNAIPQTDLDFATDGIDHAEFNGTDIVVDLSEASTKNLTVADLPITIIFEVTID